MTQEPVRVAAADDDARLNAALRATLWLFAPILVALSMVMTPFSFGDDVDHFKKAYTLAHLQFANVRPPGEKITSGGYLDTNLMKVIVREEAQYTVSARSLRPNEPFLFIRSTPWSGHTALTAVPGAVHLPLIYAPMAAAVAAGEGAGLSIENTILLSRIANGLSALLIIALSLRRLPAGLVGATLSVLALPHTLLALSSNSIDALLTAGAVAVAAFAYRAFAQGWRPRPLDWLLVGVVLVAMAGVRPPLVALALLPGCVAWRERDRLGAVVTALVVVIAVGWVVAISSGIQDPRCQSPEPLAQKLVSMAVNGPVMIVRSFLTNLNYYVLTLVGEVGWGAANISALIKLPPLAYAVSLMGLVAGLAFNCANPSKPTPLLRAAAVAAAGAYVVGVFYAMAVSCTSSASQVIHGVQGRYFIPALILVGLALSGQLKPIPMLNKAFPYVIGVMATCSMAVEIWAGLFYYWAR